MAGRGKVLVGVLLLCAISSQAPAQETPPRGQSLYENQCRTCHESGAHERKGHSVVTSLPDLHRRVAAWTTFPITSTRPTTIST